MTSYPFPTGYAVPQSDPPRSPRETLPTMYDLPSEDPEEPGLPDEFHDLQPQLLSRTLALQDYGRDRWFSGTDLNLYYDVHHPLWHKRPDWFLAIGVPRLYDGHDLRRSYVVWQEGVSPQVVVEFLSPGTEAEDLGRFYASGLQATPEEPSNGSHGGDSHEEAAQSSDLQSSGPQPPGKLQVYETYLRVPHYIVYSRYTRHLRYFKLNGTEYQEQAIQEQNPCLWLADLNVGLGIWAGTFEGIESHWLRWCDQEGQWLLTDTERAEQEQRQAEQARQQAEQEQRQAEQARQQMEIQMLQAGQNLLATGMPLAQVIDLLNLSSEQVAQLTQDAGEFPAR